MFPQDTQGDCLMKIRFALMLLAVGLPVWAQSASKLNTPPEPSFHGPRIFGSTPGRPFLQLLPVTGEAPLHFSATGLPKGLILDESKGIIQGVIQEQGTFTVTVRVENARGRAKREFTLVAEPSHIALTPPMGWNSWNIWARDMDEQKVRDAAEYLVSTGLAAYGYQYVNLDDCWEGKRDAEGNITSNERFPGMKRLGDFLHEKGLKFGIYSSPGKQTCAGYEGSYGHEKQDALAYAEWGVDYLKYDWCSYTQLVKSTDLRNFQEPFQVMRTALDACGRDIVYSWSQGGAAAVWTWGASVGGNLWRTTGDIKDTWDSMSGIGFNQDITAPYAQPGHWNDPDMLVVGEVKWGPTHLTPDEQITHMSLWSLLAAPLLIGCDLSRLNQFTLDLLTNDEVIDVDQDPLGVSATRRALQGIETHMIRKTFMLFGADALLDSVPDVWGEVWARPLSDGTLAVGLFNRGSEAGLITVHWNTLGLNEPQPVRDLWRHQDVGECKDAFTAMVPSHGAILLKIGSPESK